MSEYEYRIDYTIHRAVPDENGDIEDWEEIGFGSSGAWPDIGSADHAVSSDLDNAMWETESGHPDPDEVMADIREARDRYYD